MNLKILALISIIFLASISIAFAGDNISNSNNSLDKYVYGEDYIIVNDTIHWLSNNTTDADDLKLKESILPNKTENTPVNQNNSALKKQWIEFNWYSKHAEELGIQEYLKTHPYFDGNTVDLPEDPFPSKDYAHRLIVLSINDNDFDCAYLDSYLANQESNKTNNNSINQNNNIDDSIWQKEQAEFNWYLKHAKELGIEEYLKTHPYFDGNTVDLPEDPFPSKDYDHRLIVLSMDNHNRSSFANLDHYLEYDGNCFIMFHDPTVGGSLMNNTQVTPNNDSYQVLDDSDDIVSNNTPTVNNKFLDENKDSNNTTAANAKSVTTESTGIPIAILALAILVSVIGFRRKL